MLFIGLFQRWTILTTPDLASNHPHFGEDTSVELPCMKYACSDEINGELPYCNGINGKGDVYEKDEIENSINDSATPLCKPPAYSTSC